MEIAGHIVPDPHSLNTERVSSVSPVDIENYHIFFKYSAKTLS